MAELSPEEGARRLLLRVGAGRQLIADGSLPTEGDLKAWSGATEELLSRLYDNGSPVIRRFKSAAVRIPAGDFTNVTAMAQHRKATLENRIKLLKELSESLSEDARHVGPEMTFAEEITTTQSNWPGQHMDSKKREHLRMLFNSAKALLASMDASLDGDDQSILKFTTYATFARQCNPLVDAVAAVIQLPPTVCKFDLEKIPSFGSVVTPIHKQIFYSVHSNVSMLIAFLESTLGLKGSEVGDLANFFQVNLRRAIFTLPEKEVEVQNAVEQLLIGRGYE
jgi:hypothetical protein